MPKRLAVGFLALLSCLLQLGHAIKLKVGQEECMTYAFEQYTPFYGSFVAMPDVYGMQAAFNLVITTPSGMQVHETLGQYEGNFNLVPYEPGRYKFCLSLDHARGHPRYVIQRDVIWDLHVGHADHSLDAVKDHETDGLWHYVTQVDGQLQQLRSTLSYLYWRERRHRQTVDSTNKRVMWYAVMRAGALILVSVLQVIAVRRMFRSK